MSEEKLDQEWVQLITEARNIGISQEAIFTFLKDPYCVEGLKSMNMEANNMNKLDPEVNR